STKPLTGVAATVTNPDSPANALRIDMSTDGFATLAATYRIVPPAGSKIIDAKLSADRLGDFFLRYDTMTGVPLQKGTATQRFVPFRASAVGAAARASGQLTAGSAGSAANLANPLSTCHLEALPPTQTAAGQSPYYGSAQAGGYISGTIAFDGTYIDYTQDG